SDTLLLEQAASCSHIYANTRSLTAAQLAERRLWLARLHREGVTCGAAVITSSMPMRMLAFTELDDEAIALVVDALAEDGLQPLMLAGDLATAHRFAARLGMRASERFRLGNHVLDTAPVVAPGEGTMRAATAEDYRLVLEWEDAFIRECRLPYHRPSLEIAIRDRLAAPAPLEWLWEVDGVPVAKAHGRPTLPIARISQVYTLPERRGRGYAGALVGSLSAALQAQGCTSIFLATDMANPTSNGVYRRIGYRFVGEGTHLDLEVAS
ncbi:MAG TPA: GNAT family N-acetyltransferase, partial [Burkholderiaceae bacterium]